VFYRKKQSWRQQEYGKCKKTHLETLSLCSLREGFSSLFSALPGVEQAAVPVH
jgi:hypothetical protein